MQSANKFNVKLFPKIFLGVDIKLLDWLIFGLILTFLFHVFWKRKCALYTIRDGVSIFRYLKKLSFTLFFHITFDACLHATKIGMTIQSTGSVTQSTTACPLTDTQRCFYQTHSHKLCIRLRSTALLKNKDKRLQLTSHYWHFQPKNLVLSCTITHSQKAERSYPLCSCVKIGIENRLVSWNTITNSSNSFPSTWARL